MLLCDPTEGGKEVVQIETQRGVGVRLGRWNRR